MSMRENESGFTKFLFGLSFGVLSGYILGLLNAEKKGSELRRDIEINSSDILSVVREKIEVLKDKTSDAIQEFKGFTDEKLKASAASIEEKVNSLGEQLEELKAKQAASVKN